METKMLPKLPPRELFREQFRRLVIKQRDGDYYRGGEIVIVSRNNFVSALNPQRRQSVGGLLVEDFAGTIHFIPELNFASAFLDKLVDSVLDQLYKKPKEQQIGETKKETEEEEKKKADKGRSVLEGEVNQKDKSENKSKETKRKETSKLAQKKASG